MATVYYKGLTGIRDSVTGITFATTTIDQLVTAIATDEGLPTEYYYISLSGSPTVNDVAYGDSSTKLSTLGFTDGCTVICTTKQFGSKEERQIQKLEIAQLKRSGSAGDGSSVDIPGYRILNTYDRNLLPTKYTGNAVTDNANGAVQVAGSGLISASTSSNIVTGSSTNFTALTVGTVISSPLGFAYGTIASIQSNTQLTLTSNCITGASSVLWQYLISPTLVAGRPWS